MDFRQIEAFIYVYRLRNFSRAGDALYLTQPTISSHINFLEGELGVKLFDRSNREVIPTEAGNIFYRYAIDLLETRDSAVSSLNRYNKKVEGRLEIAASTIPSQYLLPKILNGFQNMYPGIFFHIHQGDTREVIRGMEEKKYQIGIVGARLAGDKEDKLEYKVLCSDRLLLISTKDKNSSPQNSSISLPSLLEQNFILRETGSGTRLEFEAALKKKGINPNNLKVIAEMNSPEAIKYAVREGLGVSVVSSFSVEDYIELGFIQAYTIEGLDLERFFYLVTYKNRPLSPSAAAFKDYILDFTSLLRASKV